MDISTTAWVIGAIVWFALLAYILWILGPVWKDRLVRCPETGGVTLVGLQRVITPQGQNIRVVRCALWPGKRECSRACAASCTELSHGPRAGVTRFA